MTSTLEKCTRISLQKATTPITGYTCWADKWWVVTPEQEILLYRGDVPQCNSHEQLAERVQRNWYPDCTIKFIPVVYLPPRNDS